MAPKKKGVKGVSDGLEKSQQWIRKKIFELDFCVVWRRNSAVFDDNESYPLATIRNSVQEAGVEDFVAGCRVGAIRVLRIGTE